MQLCGPLKSACGLLPHRVTIPPSFGPTAPRGRRSARRGTSLRARRGSGAEAVPGRMVRGSCEAGS